MIINKWFFCDFKKDISNLVYLRTLPFITFSDLKNVNYDLIGKILDTIHLDRKLLISIGKTQAPFGMTVDLQGKQLNVLLNSAVYSFVLTDKMSETPFLLESVLGGVIPICNLNHVFIKRLGLQSFATLPDYDNVLDKLCEIKYHQHIYNYRIALLSWNYRNQWKKWNKNV